MATTDRKQRELQQREQRLLELARTMLLERGYAGLNLDRLAGQAEFSKGTIYNHFSSKEDLVSALAVQSLMCRHQLFQRALTFTGRPRERMLALCLADDLFIAQFPNFYGSDLVIKMANLDDRISTSRQQSLHQLEQGCLGAIGSVVEEAIAAGDLVLPPHYHTGDVVFAIFAIAMGAQFVVRNFLHAIQSLGITNPQQSINSSAQALFDGLGWHPLRHEWDYEATQRRIIAEIFADEWTRAGLT